MNLQTIEKIPYSQKRVLVKEACLMYNKVKSTISHLEAHTTTESELNDFVQMSNVKNLKTASFFEVAMNMLTDDEKTVIYNDFVSLDNSQWWAQVWAKSTYYKIKHEAINRFLYLLYV